MKQEMNILKHMSEQNILEGENASKLLRQSSKVMLNEQQFVEDLVKQSQNLKDDHDSNESDDNVNKTGIEDELFDADVEEEEEVPAGVTDLEDAIFQISKTAGKMGQLTRQFTEVERQKSLEERLATRLEERNREIQDR
eukprot:UN00954